MVASDMAEPPRLAAVPRPDVLPGGLDRPEAPGPGRRAGRPERDRRQDGCRRCSAPTPSRRWSWPSTRLGPQAQHARRAEPRRADHAGLRACRAGCWCSSSGSLELTGKATIAEVWPDLEVVVHGGVKFDPYREAFAEILGRPADPPPGDLPLLRGVHRLRRPGDGPAAAGLRPRHLLRVRPGRRAGLGPPDPALAGQRPGGGQLRDRRLDLRGDVGARHRRHGPVRVARPAAADVHRADQVHALGLRRAPDQRGGRGGGRRAPRRRPGRRSATGTSGRSSASPWAITSTSSSSSSPPATSTPSAWPSTPTSAGATPTTSGTATSRASASRCRPWSWPGPAASTTGCARAASSAASTRSRAWTTRGPSPTSSSPSSARPARSSREIAGRHARPDAVGQVSGRLLLGDQPGDLADGVEVLDARLVGLDR